MKAYSHIVLMGMKHTGKSTLGAQLASRTELPWYDTDEVLAELAGKTARELYDEGGAALMMDWETRACEKLVRADAKKSIIATGGGFADNGDAMDVLKKTGLCIYIDTPFDILFDRVMASARRDGRLPRFLQGDDPERLFREIFTRRAKTYATMADIVIDAGSRTPQELTQEILDTIHEQRTDIYSRG